MPPEIIIFILVISGVAIIIWSLNLRYKRQELLHKERMTALEKGISPAPSLAAVEAPAASGAAGVYLLRGMIWLFTGIGLYIFLFNLAVTTRLPPGPPNLEDTLARVQHLRNMGVPEDQLKELLEQSKHQTRQTERIPLGLSFLGFVPIGVGLAYIIFYAIYAIEGRRTKALPSSGGTRNSGDSSMKHPNAT